MNRTDLNQERQRLTLELERARFGLERSNEFYDVAHLGVWLRQQLNTGWQHPLARAIVAHGLTADGLDVVQVAEVVELTPAEVDAIPKPPFRFRPDARVALTAEVQRRWPATLLTDDALSPEDRKIPRDQREALLARG